ncbi:thioredoxin domain-containing protein [Aestuariibaculum sediminum]|uniref:Uncharacterized protein n=1 Tax=Aestuariibaculum sediminum TaxID=2770637 RepID=A0A8J6Q045_9FLAO|nr:hypothetical protein [Aestuariibaculum sediminum]MBD0832132.1 hypothetical protein [Aestuariibaculum sediminum]
MKPFIISRIFVCLCLVFCAVGLAQDKIKTNTNKPPLSPELKAKSKILFADQYEYKKLTVIKGTLDDAFNEAKAQNKYLFVVTSYDNRFRSISEMALRNMEINENINAEITNAFLFYKCNFSDYRNKYLFWANNSIAHPSGFIFDSQGTLINIAVGAGDVANGTTLLGDFNKIDYKPFCSDLNLHGKNAIQFLNTQIAAFQTLINPVSKYKDYEQAYTNVTQSFEQQQYYFNTFLAEKLSEKLGMADTAIKYAIKRKELETNPKNKQLFDLLIE